MRSGQYALGVALAPVSVDDEPHFQSSSPNTPRSVLGTGAEVELQRESTGRSTRRHWASLRLAHGSHDTMRWQSAVQGLGYGSPGQRGADARVQPETES